MFQMKGAGSKAYSEWGGPGWGHSDAIESRWKTCSFALWLIQTATAPLYFNAPHWRLRLPMNTHTCNSHINISSAGENLLRMTQTGRQWSVGGWWYSGRLENTGWTTQKHRRQQQKQATEGTSRVRWSQITHYPTSAIHVCGLSYTPHNATPCQSSRRSGEGCGSCSHLFFFCVERRSEEAAAQI